LVLIAAPIALAVRKWGPSVWARVRESAAGKGARRNKFAFAAVSRVVSLVVAAQVYVNMYTVIGIGPVDNCPAMDAPGLWYFQLPANQVTTAGKGMWGCPVPTDTTCPFLGGQGGGTQYALDATNGAQPIANFAQFTGIAQASHNAFGGGDFEQDLEADRVKFAELCSNFVVHTPPSVLWRAFPQVRECAVDRNGTVCVWVADSSAASKEFFGLLLYYSIMIIAVKEALLVALVCYVLVRRRLPARARHAVLGSTFGPLLVLTSWYRLDEELEVRLLNVWTRCWRSCTTGEF
jgi:hypothetical protein